MSYNLSQNSFESTNDDKREEIQFWQESYPKLERYCQFLTQNKWDGEDIAQETYLKALKYTNQPHKLSTPLLNKIAYNHWIDLLRKRKKEILEADTELARKIYLPLLDESMHSVELLLEKFTPKQAVIFLLKEGFQYQLKEIAEILHSTEIAIKANLHRAKQRLEKEEENSTSLESYWDEAEREQLSKLFYETLQNQDPAILIKSITALKSLSEGPKLRSSNVPIRRNFSPTSTLSMAA